MGICFSNLLTSLCFDCTLYTGCPGMEGVQSFAQSITWRFRLSLEIFGVQSGMVPLQETVLSQALRGASVAILEKGK